jgi:hypothetical protein
MTEGSFGVLSLSNSFSTPDRGERIFSFSKMCGQALGFTQPPIRCVPGALSPAVKRPGPEAERSHLSNA